jgi:uncharacterized protein with PQ loop repeat
LPQFDTWYPYVGNGTWHPYAGTEAVVLGVILLATGVLLAWLGTRLTGPLKAGRPGRTIGISLVLVWVLSLAVCVIALMSYVVQLQQEHPALTLPTNPIHPVTGLSAAVAFVIIAYASRDHGWRTALGSAFIGTAAAAMFFEMPFDLIVMARALPPIPPEPNLYRLLFFLPRLLVEISTLSLLTLSPLTRLSRYTLFSLAGMFLMFSIWAFLGFGYPSDPPSIAFNGISKVLAFVAAVTMFVDVHRRVLPGPVPVP